MAEKASAVARAVGVSKVTVEVREGGIAEPLLGFPKGSKADLVIVGSRGQSTFGALLLGSVAEAVIHHSPCQVLVHR